MPNPQPLVLAIANQKGGVGKTTTAINLAAGLAARDLPTLLIDLDPQGNASTGLGFDRAGSFIGTYELLLGDRPITDAISATSVRNLSLIAADTDLVGAEIELVEAEDRSHRLAKALSGLPKGRFRAVVIDCPPSLGLLNLNGLAAADAVLVPLQCEFFALEGISQLMRTIDRVKGGLNARLKLAGIVLTMYDRRNNLTELVADDARSFFGDKVYETSIPRNIRISESPSHGLPVLTYDPRSSGAIAYMQLVDELIRRENLAYVHRPDPSPSMEACR